jgi:hypothetical protein
MRLIYLLLVTPLLASGNMNICLLPGQVNDTPRIHTAYRFGCDQKADSIVTAESVPSLYEITPSFERHRIWLNLSGPQGPLAQIMIAYITGATLGEDIGYDGRSIDQVPYFASNIGEYKYTIQARPVPFDNTDLVDLTYTAPFAGNYTVSIQNMDGLFSASQPVYIRDVVANVVHDLKESPYTFESEAGTFADRLAIVYQNETLSIGTPVSEHSNMIIYKSDNSLHISTTVSEMTTVRVFDIRGRKLYEKTGLSTREWSEQLPVSSKQVLIVQVTSADTRIATQKVVY